MCSTVRLPTRPPAILFVTVFASFFRLHFWPILFAPSSARLLSVRRSIRFYPLRSICFYPSYHSLQSAFYFLLLRPLSSFTSTATRPACSLLRGGSLCECAKNGKVACAVHLSSLGRPELSLSICGKCVRECVRSNFSAARAI